MYFFRITWSPVLIYLSSQLFAIQKIKALFVFPKSNWSNLVHRWKKISLIIFSVSYKTLQNLNKRSLENVFLEHRGSNGVFVSFISGGREGNESVQLSFVSFISGGREGNGSFQLSVVVPFFPFLAKSNLQTHPCWG